MSRNTPVDIRERTFKFACDIFDFSADLAKNPGIARSVAYQLFSSGSSVGANLEEAKAAYSRRDFAAKTAISLKECREANYWLRLAHTKSLGDPSKRLYLLDESNQLISILTTTVKRLQT